MSLCHAGIARLLRCCAVSKTLQPGCRPGSRRIPKAMLPTAKAFAGAQLPRHRPSSADQTRAELGLMSVYTEPAPLHDEMLFRRGFPCRATKLPLLSPWGGWRTVAGHLGFGKPGHESAWTLRFAHFSVNPGSWRASNASIRTCCRDGRKGDETSIPQNRILKEQLLKAIGSWDCVSKNRHSCK